jgi:inositol transport system ATP-binding protein
MMRKDLMSMETILEVEDICKSFAGNRVLDDVTFSTEVGQVHALVGENGAGKTTLMNIIGGIHQPDEGTIYLNGQPASFADPVQAMQSGISIVHQELSLVPNLNVAQNIFSNGQTSSMASREKLNRLGFIKWKELYADTRELLEHVRIDIEPTTMVSKLPVSIQQLVEIARAISFDAQVLILDEPTSALSEKEIDHLYDVIRELKEKGVATIFISHKLAEVFAIADQVSVLRDGKMVGTVKTEETSRDEIIQMMVGRHIEDMYPDKSSEVKDTILSVEGFSRPPYFQDVSFDLRRGEILGFAGLVGSGRTEVARAVFGADKADSGQVTLGGEPIQIGSPREAIDHGVCYLTEDRKTLGLFLKMSVRDNIVAASLYRFISKIGLLKRRSIRDQSKHYVDFMEIRPPDDEVEMISLSGGNQQKSLLAKWLCSQPKVLIADEPTRGVDVGAKAKLHADLRQMAEEGIGVIVISSELPEVLGLSDRVAVFREGQITAILEGNQATQEEVMKHATQ